MIQSKFFNDYGLTKSPTIGKDQYGYYSIGDNFKTYSKLEAIEKSKQLGKPFVWNFNQYETDNFNWEIEPKETLDELYRLRAEEIRAKYDYVVLMFSGGRDSSNIFHAFTRNNIQIDEVITYKYDGGIEDQLTDFKDTDFVPGRIKEAEELGYPYKIKRRHIDLSKIVDQFNLFGQFQLLNRGYLQNHHYSISHYAKSYIREYVPEYRAITNSSKKMCIIWGCDKPFVGRVVLPGGSYRYAIYYADYSIDATVPVNTQLRDMDQEFDEMFYWGNTKIALSIVSKQGYTISKFLESVKLGGMANLNASHLYSRCTTGYKLMGDESISDEHWKVLRSAHCPPFATYRDISDWLIYPSSFDVVKHRAFAKIGVNAIKTESGNSVVFANKFASMRDVRWASDSETKRHFDMLNQQLSEHKDQWRRPDEHFVQNTWRWNLSKIYLLGN